MTYGTTHEVLKPLNEVMLADPRFENHSITSAGGRRKFAIADLHERISISVLRPEVPEDVRRQFEIARNLMLYSWFVYEFHIVAEQHAYGALERALRIVLPGETRTIGKKVLPQTLGHLLRTAKEKRLIVPERLSFWQWLVKRREQEPEPEKLPPLDLTYWFEQVVKTLPDMRNNLAHGGFRLYLGGAFTTGEICADFINALFTTAHEKPKAAKK
jgi:hypothetical protein